MSKRTKNNKPTNPVGRPTKFNEAVQRKIIALALAGKTDRQIAEIIDVHEDTITKWKKYKPEFLWSLKEAKQEADALVEASLFQRAVGYSHQAVHFTNYFGTVVETEYVKHYPPSEVAAIFWLKNRQPEKWREKVPDTVSEDNQKDIVYTAEWSTDLPETKKDPHEIKSDQELEEHANTDNNKD